ncbi:MAG TPA: hypothetical protein VF384_08450 [Planctomycetota bacterium]
MAIANKKPKARAKGVATGGRPRKGAGPQDVAGENEVDEAERSTPPLAEVDAEVLEFIAAIERFKRQHARPFPSWSEVLLVLRQLGYRRS